MQKIQFHHTNVLKRTINPFIHKTNNYHTPVNLAVCRTKCPLQIELDVLET